MSEIRSVVGGIVLAFTIAGCGDSPPEAGPVEYKASNSPEIEAFTKRMSENAKGKAGMKRPVEAPSKPGDTKPGTDAKAETKKE
jgi:hypothetical protein